MRRHLLEVACRSIRDLGLAGATLRAIAERADVNPALLHYYFGSKSELHAAVIEKATSESAKRFARLARGPGTVRERLGEVIRAYTESVRRSPEVMRMALERCLEAGPADAEPSPLSSEVTTPLAHEIFRLVQEGVDNGELRPVDPAVVVGAIASQCISVAVVEPLLHSFGVGEPGDNLGERWAEFLPEFLLRGVAAAPPP